MLELGTGMMVVVFVFLGVLIAFVVAWILKAEKVREVYLEEVQRLKRESESKNRQMSMINDQLEDSQSIVKELESTSSPFDKLLGKGHGLDEEAVAQIPNRLKELEEENDRLNGEINEARDSLEEVYKAVYED